MKPFGVIFGNEEGKITVSDARIFSLLTAVVSCAASSMITRNRVGDGKDAVLGIFF